MTANSPDDIAILPRPDLSRQLTEQIIRLIAARNLQPGDRLPTMRELAATFSVATPTIREALRRLQATGVIDIRHGSGIYVMQTSQELMIANPHRSELDNRAVLDLLAARLVIEPHLASLAAERRTTDDIARLEAILLEAEALLSGHDLELSPRNMDFHGHIARIAGNMILASVINSLIDVYAHEQRVILALYDAREEDHREHVTIFEAIRDGNPETAAEHMKNHLQGVLQVIGSRLES